MKRAQILLMMSTLTCVELKLVAWVLVHAGLAGNLLQVVNVIRARVVVRNQGVLPAAIGVGVQLCVQNSTKAYGGSVRWRTGDTGDATCGLQLTSALTVKELLLGVGVVLRVRHGWEAVFGVDFVEAVDNAAGPRGIKDVVVVIVCVEVAGHSNTHGGCNAAAARMQEHRRWSGANNAAACAHACLGTAHILQKRQASRSLDQTRGCSRRQLRHPGTAGHAGAACMAGV